MLKGQSLGILLSGTREDGKLELSLSGVIDGITRRLRSLAVGSRSRKAGRMSKPNVGPCVGGTNHGTMVSNWGEFLRLPEAEELSALAELSSEIPMDATHTIEEYHWTTLDFRSGPVSFWRHSSLNSREEILRLLIQSPI